MEARLEGKLHKLTTCKGQTDRHSESKGHLELAAAALSYHFDKITLQIIVVYIKTL